MCDESTFFFFITITLLEFVSTIYSVISIQYYLSPPRIAHYRLDINKIHIRTLNEDKNKEFIEYKSVLRLE
jgi:hypothetical protein